MRNVLVPTSIVCSNTTLIWNHGVKKLRNKDKIGNLKKKIASLFINIDNWHANVIPQSALSSKPKVETLNWI